ncbi:hypothetical protein RR47_GL001121 [Enterococcus columbae DSM 7374 = ATCC 51263]|nr:hypothetical protein RR47_GL001121 [Enterococcus columbae DSM 7374 = ATCC 51263]
MDGKIPHILRFFQQLGLFTEYQLNNMPFTLEAMRQLAQTRANKLQRDGKVHYF